MECLAWPWTAAMASSVQDQIGELVRMRDQRQMTGLNLSADFLRLPLVKTHERANCCHRGRKGQLHVGKRDATRLTGRRLAAVWEHQIATLRLGQCQVGVGGSCPRCRSGSSIGTHPLTLAAHAILLAIALITLGVYAWGILGEGYALQCLGFGDR